MRNLLKSIIIALMLIGSSIDFIYSGCCNGNSGGGKTNLTSSRGSRSKPVDVLGNKGKLVDKPVSQEDEVKKRQEEEREKREADRNEFEGKAKKVQNALNTYLESNGMKNRCSCTYRVAANNGGIFIT